MTNIYALALTYQSNKAFLLSNSNASICDSFLSTYLEMGNAKSPFRMSYEIFLI